MLTLTIKYLLMIMLFSCYHEHHEHDTMETITVTLLGCLIDGITVHAIQIICLKSIQIKGHILSTYYR